MNTLLAALASLTKYRFNNLKLVISLPIRIPDHIEQFIVYPDVQCLCRKPDTLRLSGVKMLEFMVDSKNSNKTFEREHPPSVHGAEPLKKVGDV
jgi:hypothetical protein